MGKLGTVWESAGFALSISAADKRRATESHELLLARRRRGMVKRVYVATDSKHFIIATDLDTGNTTYCLASED